MDIDKNFQILRLEPRAAKQVLSTMGSLKGNFGGVEGIEGGKGPSGTKCSSTNAGLEPIGRADFECDDSD